MKKFEIKNVIIFIIIIIFNLNCKTHEAVFYSFSYTLQPDIILQLRSTIGENGSSVVFNPSSNLYYTFFAGNKSFPIEIFDSESNYVTTTKTGADVRGVWYNNLTKQVECNTFKGNGIYQINILKNIPTGETTEIFKTNEQPNENSAVAFDYDLNELLYLDKNTIKRYSRTNNKFLGTIKITGLPEDSTINFTSIAYLGYSNNEIGLLDYYNRNIYTIDKNTGNYNLSLILPPDTKTYPKLRFSYANKHIWIFDLEARKWLGYKIPSYYFDKITPKKKKFLGIF